MRHLAFALAPVVFLFGLSYSNGQTPFPNSINVTKTAGMKRIKGTKLFVSAPDSYKQMEGLTRLKRDDSTFLEEIYIPFTNFSKYKSKLTKEALEPQIGTIDIDKPVKYNGYDAIYFSGFSKEEGETRVVLVFGDSTFALMMVGGCRTADKAAIRELNKMLSTFYYDESLKFNPLETTNIKFDESITGFKYATTMNNMFVYSPTGRSDNILSNFMLSSHIEPSFSKAKELLDGIISNYSENGVQVSNVKKREIVIHGNNAYESTMETIHAGNKNGILYDVIIYKGTKAVLFQGEDDEQGKWLNKFKATVQSIKM